MTHALQLIDQVDLAQASRRSRKLLNRRALVGAAVGAIPLPGFDWAVDAALLSRLIPAINAEFGLTPEQLDRLTPQRREQVQQALALVGSALLGKFITKELIIKAAHVIGVRLASAQAAKLVPIAGQAASAAMGYLAIRYFGEMHIKDCIQAVESTRLGNLAQA